MGCCVTTSRVLLFILNMAQMLVALAVIALALWIRLDNNFEREIRNNIKVDTDPEPLSDIKYDMRVGILVAFWVIIGVSIACALLGLVGFCGAAAKSRALLVIYFVSQIVIILLEIACGIVVLVKRSDVRSTVKDYVATSFQMNTNDAPIIVQRYNCCGVENMVILQCFGQNVSNCSAAVWDRLDFSMMIFGISMILVIVLQILASILSMLVFVDEDD